MRPSFAAAWRVVACCLAIACHHRARPAETVTDRPVLDSASAAIFADTTVGVVHHAQAREFDLGKPAQRDSLRVLLRRERALWRTQDVKSYRFLGRVACFCPGPQEWLLVEVRDSVLVSAVNPRGKRVPLTDWSLFTIDKLFDDLNAMLPRNASVQVAFDPRWHYPTLVSTTMRPGPDAWSITEVRAFRKL